MKSISLGCLSGLALCAAPALAQDTVLKNDFLVNGGTVAIQAGFIAREAGVSLFRMPASPAGQFQVKRVLIFWKSLFPPPGAAPVIQDSVSVWLPLGGPNGTRPQNRIFESDPPQLIDGFLNEFPFEQMNPPILVNAGSNFFAGLVFSEPPNPFAGPSLVTDTAGCQPGTSWVLDNGITWTDLCTYRDFLGRPPSGTFVIRVVVAPYVVPQPLCFVDFNNDGFLTQEDLSGFLTAVLDESVPPGPSGTNRNPCPAALPPYGTLGYAADYNRDCTFNQEDLSGFITEYFGQTEQPSGCVPG